MRSRPTLLKQGQEDGRGSWLIIGLIIALLVVLLAPFASGHPDGLEWVAGITGFGDMAQEGPYQLLPGYTLPFLGETALSTILAGFIGIVVVAAVIISVAKAAGSREKRVAGMSLSKENLPFIRAKVGLVFQNPDDQLFSPTVFDDVAFGPLHMGYEEDEVRQRTEKALVQVGMGDLLANTPLLEAHGLESPR